MARQFSHPNVAALAEGESTTIIGIRRGVVTRRVDAFGVRKGRSFAYEATYGPDNDPAVLVTRLPDPEPQP